MNIVKKTNSNFFPLFIFPLVFFCTVLSAQKDQDLLKLIHETNQFYGANDLLNLGELYRPDKTTAKGDPYFLNTFSPAEIIVKGNIFENILAKYNLETDKLIIQAKIDTAHTMIITAKEAWIDDFMMDSHHFVTIDHLFPALQVTGYYELVYQGTKSFFIKYKKSFINTYNELNPSGFYTGIKTTFYVFDGVNFIPVKRKKTFLNLYAEHKKDVKKYLRKNKITYSKASTAELNKLMQFCDNIYKAI